MEYNKIQTDYKTSLIIMKEAEKIQLNGMNTEILKKFIRITV